MTPEDRRLLWRHMRAPMASFVVLLGLLAIMVVLGAVAPFAGTSVAEALVLLGMVLTVLLVSMEITREPPLIRLFAALGFFWVFILFGMTLVDYLSR